MIAGVEEESAIYGITVLFVIMHSTMGNLMEVNWKKNENSKSIISHYLSYRCSLTPILYGLKLFLTETNSII